MFAIVEIAGAQHKVSKGAILTMEKLDAAEGAKLTSDKVLMKFDDKSVEMGTPYLRGAKVEFTVKSHGKGEKIRVFKKQPKKRFQKTQGHRQQYTQVEVTAIH